ncbi:MAG: GGDEF domain-containing protein [Campylobacterota bacterium]|nr:GGDEF domain-containing protein [Campylobacterota bacterium]
MYSQEIEKIAKKTLANLEERKINSTPREFEKEFCKLSKEIKLDTNECKYFQYSLSKLSNKEKKIAQSKNIESVYDLIDVLLQRVEQKNIQKMSQIMTSSLQPSISVELNDDLESFCIKIGDSPTLIFEETIQHEMEAFIEQRIEVDKKVLTKKTADIARLISLMNKYLNDAINTGKKGSSNISDIENKISKLNLDQATKKELNTIQVKLKDAAQNIQSELNDVSTHFISSQDEINKLESRVKELENELRKTKKQSDLDHLTQTLNRRAFDKQIKIFEEKHQRLHQDFAIVFFDIDHFKKVNDNYGHECGDIILKTFASLLVKLTRDIDIIARFGGEEFVGIIHFNDIDELNIYLSRIKNVVTKNKFVYNEHKLRITFSAGVQLRSNTKSSDDAIHEADELLYKAKQSGRNKIKLWDGSTI